ncbi:MAG: archaetidylserine decarboxylase [Gammaproteobacteria bacterium]|nr:archaetidylserine decarboxylase [Gammaproteobacteria bacterium]MDH5729490.1 archaetidylserine decarboxylase [Gammaproteobacteria bacterium]
MTSNNSSSGKFSDFFKVLPQYFLPHHFLSSWMYRLTRITWRPLKNLAIKAVIRLYDVDMKQAQINNIEQFTSFNDFFTRELKPEARPLCAGQHSIACPVDGRISQIGKIENEDIFQAKGQSFSLTNLLGGSQQDANAFLNGNFTTIYLSPRDYHRIHMPFNGRLERMLHIPGRLFSVNPATTRRVPGLFARNERVVSIFSTDIGPMAVILVGAIFVSSMDTVWAGTITPSRSKNIRAWQYEPQGEQAIYLNKGDELGRFNMGSTVILLFGENQMQWLENLNAGDPVEMGMLLGTK